MAFRTNAAPYQRSSKTTTQIMLELCIALGVIWFCAIVANFVKLGASYGVRAILIMLIALFTTEVCDVLTVLIKHKKGGKTSLKEEIINALKYNYSYVTAAIFALTLPAWTNYYVVIVGSIFATVVVKNFFGGFGKNIFNPAAMARIFVMICFANGLSASGVNSGIDVTTGATVTTLIKSSSWLCDAYPIGLTAFDVLFGNYFGAMGETFTVIILVLGIILAIRKDLDWRTPAFYLTTVLLTSLVIALATGLNPFNYLVLSLGLGGVMFGAFFMLTDPVTGPTSKFGKALMGVVAGLLTVLIRIKGNYPEGVVLSIAVCNILSPAVDYFVVGKTNDKLKIKYGVVFGLLAIAIGLNTAIAVNIKSNMNTEPLIADTLSLKDGHVAKTSEEGNSTYTIYEGDNIVAYAYKVEASEQDAYGDKFKMSGIVIINVSDDTLYGICSLENVASDDYFIEALNNYALTLAGKSLSEATVDATMEASQFSLPALKELINNAYTLHNEGRMK